MELCVRMLGGYLDNGTIKTFTKIKEIPSVLKERKKRSKISAKNDPSSIISEITAMRSEDIWEELFDDDTTSPRVSREESYVMPSSEEAVFMALKLLCDKDILRESMPTLMALSTLNAKICLEKQRPSGF